jgi:hypothetical protein
MTIIGYRLRLEPASGRNRSNTNQDDDGRKQGGKSTATCPLEFQIVNKVAGRLYSVM